MGEEGGEDGDGPRGTREEGGQESVGEKTVAYDEDTEGVWERW